MNFRITRREALASSVAGLALSSTALAEPRVVYKDPSASPSARARDLLARMTLEEKAAQLCCKWFTKGQYLEPDGSFSSAKAKSALGLGIGQLSRPHDSAGTKSYPHTFRTIADSVALMNAVQRFLVNETRLGIPALFHDEAAHGLLAGGATVFPIPPGLASSWDLDLVEQVYSVAASETRARGSQVVLAPVVDLARDPRYGRVEEFYGEDPYLVAQMGIAAVRGCQGRVRPLGRDRVFATLKHFVHGTPQGGLNIAPSDVGERTMRETYLVPFERIVKEADPAIIMPSYNEVQGVPAHASVDLLQATGRRRLQFKGAYFSDYGGVENLKSRHHVAGSKEDAAVLAMNAGVQVDLPEGECYAAIPGLVRSGRIAEAQVDAAVASVLSLKFEAGLFENPYVDAAQAARKTGTAANTALARTAAEKALVLLKNDGILPLSSGAPLKIALIGPNSVEPMFGGYSGGNDKAVGILEGLRRGAPRGATIEQADGVWIAPPDKDGTHGPYSMAGYAVPVEENRARIDEAVKVARRSDVVVLAVGDVPALTREAVDFEMPGDRSTLGLWGMQDDLVEAMIATGKPIVALLINGRPLTVNRLAEKANALLEGWYLGQEGGTAFANVLFGRVNPGGKLTVTFPRSVGELPVYYNRHPTADVNHYIEAKRDLLFPFGHGLSFTTFDLSAPRLGKTQIGRAESVDVEIDVTNTGARSGDEVVQLYIRDELSSVPRPVLELRRFKRVTLSPGEKRTVSFRLDPDDLAFWDIGMNWTVEPGAFAISAGASSAKLKAVTLTVTA